MSGAISREPNWLSDNNLRTLRRWSRAYREHNYTVRRKDVRRRRGAFLKPIGARLWRRRRRNLKETRFRAEPSYCYYGRSVGRSVGRTGRLTCMNCDARSKRRNLLRRPCQHRRRESAMASCTRVRARVLLARAAGGPDLVDCWNWREPMPVARNFF